ncbi:hypothetical protein QTP88_014812 [Uroleucon formosanum]
MDLFLTIIIAIHGTLRPFLLLFSDNMTELSNDKLEACSRVTAFDHIIFIIALLKYNSITIDVGISQTERGKPALLTATVYDVKQRAGSRELHRFVNYFRMTREQFEEIHELVSPRISKLTTNWRKPIGTKERLAICLR